MKDFVLTEIKLMNVVWNVKYVNKLNAYFVKKNINSMNMVIVYLVVKKDA